MAKKVLSMVQSDLKRLPTPSHNYTPQGNAPPSTQNPNPNPSFRNLPLTIPKRDDACSVVTVQNPTFPITVQRLPMPTGYLVSYRNENFPVQLWPAILFRMEWPFRMHPPSVKEANTPVPYVDHLPTTLSIATPFLSLLVVNTPFIPDEWERMLNTISPFNEFTDLPNSLCSGFDMGTHTPPAHTYTPPNHNSALSYPNHVISHIHKDLSLRRYSGPFSRSTLEFLIGPFWTSPLGTVPKSHDSSEWRIVQDLSFPRNDPSHASVNSQIDINNFRCNWGTFNDVRNIVMDAPPSSEAATLDVDSTFRCCPILPSQQSSFIIHWNDSFFIDHNSGEGRRWCGGDHTS